MLTSLEHMQIPVRQMDRAISWYIEHLGFRLSSRDGDRIAFLTLPEGPMPCFGEPGTRRMPTIQ
jgi:catechol 2,3-dioxygenase-like lactoylglutathione lyase family enzyme